MNRTIKITYWVECPKFPKGVPSQLVNPLEDDVQSRITDCMKESYVEGELNGYVFPETDIPKKKTPEDGFAYKGGFQIEKINE